MEKNDYQKQFDEIYSVHMDWFTDRLTLLVSQERIDDSDSLYTEYVVDGEEPDDSLYFTCPRIKNYWGEPFKKLIEKIME